MMAPNTQPEREERATSPAKRKRVVSTDTEAQHLSDSGNRPPTKKARLATDLSISAADDSRVLQAVDSKYEVQIHSVISSSKIQKKVSSVLRHLTPATPEGASATRPQVSVLRAKACDAGKLVSIAEIAKREIAAQKGDYEAGRWFQYIGLGQEIRETWKEKAVIEETILGGADRPNDNEDDGDDGEEDDFEYMKTPLERAIEGKPKKQAIAIMSLFLARVSVDELKRRYGEQTNAETSRANT